MYELLHRNIRMPVTLPANRALPKLNGLLRAAMQAGQALRAMPLPLRLPGSHSYIFYRAEPCTKTAACTPLLDSKALIQGTAPSLYDRMDLAGNKPQIFFIPALFLP